jgi:hypothetical protein
MFKTLAALVGLVVLAWFYHHVFVDTLTMAEIVGPTGNATGDIFVNLFDFDTGLTRYDVYNLASHCDEWNARMAEIEAIGDIARREAGRERLLAEMMLEPSFKKVARGVFGLGAQSAFALMKTLAAAR